MATAAVIGGAALVGGGIQAEGQRKQARAAGKAAQARESAAGRQQQLAIESAESPQELAALERSLGVQEKSLARQERLVQALDPAIIEASQQALQLLRGESAAALDPIKKQRDQDRQKLVNTLREQLGSGAETTSAGQQALQNFDFQTSQVLAGQQQQSLSQLFQFGSSGGNQLASTAAGFQNIAGGFGNIASRRVGAVTGTGQAVTQAAGSRFVRSQLQGQGTAQIGAGITSLAGTVGGAAFAGGFGKDKKVSGD
jgi:hypothetical protein